MPGQNKKDAYFFPHYCNARHDRKIKRVVKELGIEGYGIYFMLLEVLREQTDLRFPMSDIDLLADEFKTSEQKIRIVICNYGLFDVDENENFFSFKLVFYLQPYFEKVKRAKKAANKRWENAKLQVSDANAYANALPEYCFSNANAMLGEVREIREVIEDKTSSQKNKFSEEDLSLAEYMLEKIMDIGYTKKVNVNKWAETIRLMRERDGVKLEDARIVFDWANNDSFWQKNILSADKFRKQYQRLKLESRSISINKGGDDGKYDRI
jgi:hypothetical protein